MAARERAPQVPMPSTMRRAALVVLLALAFHASPAQAQAPSPKAQKYLDEGVALEKAGKWGRALEKYEKALEQGDGAQVRFHMARAKEQLTRFREALEDARAAQSLAERHGAQNLAEISELREWLEGRTPQLVITRGDGAEGAKIEIGGRELTGTEPVRLDPGTHTIAVTFTDGAKLERSVSIGAGEQDEIEITRPDELAPPVTEPRAEAPGPPPEPAKAPPEPGSPVAAYVVGGVGAASLIASGVFVLLRNQAVADLDAACRGSVCPESAQPRQDEAKTFTTVARVTLGVGVAALGVATVLLLTHDGGGDEPSASEPRWRIAGGPVPASVGVARSF